MLGSIIGDIAGSYYEVLEIGGKRNYNERIKIMDKSVPLFDSNSSPTDDSILTCAIMDAILNAGDYEEYLRKYSLSEIKEGLDMYGRSRFSPGFVKWVLGEREGNSFGSGAAMRVSSVGFLFGDLSTVVNEARRSSLPSHNNIEAIKSAEAVASSIFLLRNGISKDDLKKYIEDNYYKLDYDLEELRMNHRFSPKASNTVAEAIFVFLESDDFEDAIRKSISIGGDADTIAAICGGLAEAHYGIPLNIVEMVKPYLKDYMYDLLKDRYFNKKNTKKLEFSV